jgi:hypothetical protein
MAYIYVLLLENNKYFINTSSDSCVFERIIPTFYSKWTTLHAPKLIIKALKVDKDDIDLIALILTIRYMREKGIDNVRGSVFNEDVLSKKERDIINDIIQCKIEICLYCNKKTHYSINCKYANNNQQYVYSLKLENNKYYVGRTFSMITDIDYYKTQIEQPLWLKCNKMISVIQVVDISKYLNYIIKDCTNFINIFDGWTQIDNIIEYGHNYIDYYDLYITLKLMKQCGVNNVRGSVFFQLYLSSDTQLIITNMITPTFIDVSNQVKLDIKKCSNCMHIGHNTEECTVRFHKINDNHIFAYTTAYTIAGKIVEFIPFVWNVQKDSTLYNKFDKYSIKCMRCGNDGHNYDKCTSIRDINNIIIHNHIPYSLEKNISIYYSYLSQFINIKYNKSKYIYNKKINYVLPIYDHVKYKLIPSYNVYKDVFKQFLSHGIFDSDIYSTTNKKELEFTVYEIIPYKPIFLENYKTCPHCYMVGHIVKHDIDMRYINNIGNMDICYEDMKQIYSNNIPRSIQEHINFTINNYFYTLTISAPPVIKIIDIHYLHFIKIKQCNTNNIPKKHIPINHKPPIVEGWKQFMPVDRQNIDINIDIDHDNIKIIKKKIKEYHEIKNQEHRFMIKLIYSHITNEQLDKMIMIINHIEQTLSKIACEWDYIVVYDIITTFNNKKIKMFLYLIKEYKSISIEYCYYIVRDLIKSSMDTFLFLYNNNVDINIAIDFASRQYEEILLLKNLIVPIKYKYNYMSMDINYAIKEVCNIYDNIPPNIRAKWNNQQYS